MAQVDTAPTSFPKCDTVCSQTMHSIQSSDSSSDEQLAKRTAKSANKGAEPSALASSIAEAYQKISADIAACAANSNRDPNTVNLLAVSKTRTANEVGQAYQAGARHFGENYLQDALPKLDALAEYADIVWHYIGALQSNKTSDIATHFDWVHTVDRSKIARRLNQARSQSQSAGTKSQPLNVCLQVNLHDESQKAGCAPDELPDLIATIAELPHLTLRGLMILPAKSVAPEQAFADTAALFEQLRTQTSFELTQWDTLSMGMSGDYPAAINAGSTIVRIGTALFGARALK